MSILKNLLGAFVPVRERRETSGTLTALNQEVVMDLNGDSNAMVYVLSDLFVGTLEFTGAMDSAGSLYFPIQAYAYSVGCNGGTIPLAGQPLLIDALVAANLTRVYAVPVGQLKKLRIRASAYTSGNCVVHIVSDVNRSLHPSAGDQDPSTLAVSATGASGAAVTLTMPAVAGLRIYLDSLQIVRSPTIALTANAAPVLVTSTNLPGTPAFTFGQDAAAIGVDKEVRLDCGSEGLAASVLGTAVTVVCPVFTGVIWRLNAVYHLGT